MKNKKRTKIKGSWTIVTVLLIPVFLSMLIFFSVYNGSKKIMQNRTQNALDSAKIYMAGHGNVSTVINKDGTTTQFCTLEHNEMNELYNTFVSKGLIKTINGYNKYWCIKTYDSEGNYLGFKTFEEIEGSTSSKVNYYYTNNNMNENVGITIRVIIPFRRLENYTDYYTRYDVSFSLEEQKEIKEWNSNSLFLSPIVGWIVFDVSAYSSCY